MIPRAKLIRWAHASVSTALLVVAVAAVVSVVVGEIAAYGARVRALKMHEENAVMLEARLQDTRAKIRKGLAAIDASVEDLETVASPSAAAALVGNACRTLAIALSGGCETLETPLTSSLSLHQAKFSTQGSLAQIIPLLKASATPPIRIASIEVAAGAEPDRIHIAALIEVTAARSGGR